MSRVLRNLCALTLFFSLLVFSVGCGSDDEKPTYTVENFTVYDSDLNEVELEDYIGKPIVVNFWASWCYYCKIEMPDFNEAYKSYPDVQFMMINYTDGNDETVATARAYIEETGYEFPVFFDRKLDASEKYGVEAFPTTFFISASGDLVKAHRGAMSLETLQEYLALIC